MIGGIAPGVTFILGCAVVGIVVGASMTMAVRHMHGMRLRIAVAQQNREGRGETLQRHHRKRQEQNQLSTPSHHVTKCIQIQRNRNPPGRQRACAKVQALGKSEPCRLK